MVSKLTKAHRNTVTPILRSLEAAGAITRTNPERDERGRRAVGDYAINLAADLDAIVTARKVKRGGRSMHKKPHEIVRGSMHKNAAEIVHGDAPSMHKNDGVFVQHHAQETGVFCAVIEERESTTNTILPPEADGGGDGELPITILPADADENGCWDDVAREGETATADPFVLAVLLGEMNHFEERDAWDRAIAFLAASEFMELEEAMAVAREAVHSMVADYGSFHSKSTTAPNEARAGIIAAINRGGPSEQLTSRAATILEVAKAQADSIRNERHAIEDGKRKAEALTQAKAGLEKAVTAFAAAAGAQVAPILAQADKLVAEAEPSMGAIKALEAVTEAAQEAIAEAAKGQRIASPPSYLRAIHKRKTDHQNGGSKAA
ncbi:hypothetical protein CCC_03125 [Paramagnetospirillum magnetotacticum MS-1]|uniref:Uncharacterized protein n=1 Tax=Paramagnetospirillum magnetotacticum MS-1 TaxID=272627 RepID=A0A0C2UG70_PARME|nr:hypothetical protein CCC_03125 [Paramagnetospirillum magnetotacticum MS-1]